MTIIPRRQGFGIISNLVAQCLATQSDTKITVGVNRPEVATKIRRKFSTASPTEKNVCLPAAKLFS
jgi:hypothetical protein